jgi:Helix-turn-helix of DDE superfamily endonuclease
MNCQCIQKLNPRAFKRCFGVRKKTFKRIVKILKSFQSINRHTSSGAKPLLGIEEQVLVTLEYWREYRTYFHIATSWGVSESTICRIVHRIESELMQSGMFRLPGKKALLKGLNQPEVVVMDVTETPIERPKRKQKEFYSGILNVIPLKAN